MCSSPTSYVHKTQLGDDITQVGETTQKGLGCPKDKYMLIFLNNKEYLFIYFSKTKIFFFFSLKSMQYSIDY